jgi:uncharacterized protein (DUF1697 family)
VEARRLEMSLVVFMRGVNVGSAKRFQPSLLAKQLGHLRISNLGAAGTFVVRGAKGEAALRAELLTRLPFACDLMVCQGRDLLKLTATDPFPESSSQSEPRRFVSILAKRPRNPPPLPWSYPLGDQWQVKLVGISGRFVLCLWRRLGSSSVEPNGVIEKHLGVRSTTRNWNTILRSAACSRRKNDARHADRRPWRIASTRRHGRRSERPHHRGRASLSRGAR